jgi:hypothetical protein
MSSYLIIINNYNHIINPWKYQDSYNVLYYW